MHVYWSMLLTSLKVAPLIYQVIGKLKICEGDDQWISLALRTSCWVRIFIGLNSKLVGQLETSADLNPWTNPLIYRLHMPLVLHSLPFIDSPSQHVLAFLPPASSFLQYRLYNVPFSNSTTGFYVIHLHLSRISPRFIPKAKNDIHHVRHFTSIPIACVGTLYFLEFVE